MLIFKAEKDIADNIKADTTISYVAGIEKFEVGDMKLLKPTLDEFVSKSSVKDDELYFYKSILVSTTLNKNDDYFGKEIVWAAKDTPTDKPVNVMHDSTKVVGHTVSSFAIDVDGNLIDPTSSVDELPNKFHLLVGSVLYKKWHSSEEHEKAMAKLIEAIENGEMFVSQECRFKSFDYFLSNEKETTIVARNKDTAFLTKYLRAYGGEGTYQDYTIARAVRDISFIGKGLVDKPANPESTIILPKNDIFEFADAKVNESFQNSENFGVILKSNVDKTETNIMSDTFYKEQADELKNQNTNLVKALDEMKEKVTQSNVTKLEKEIESLSAQVKDMGDVLKKKSDDVVAKEALLSEATQKFEDLTKSFDELTKQNKELNDKVLAVEIESKTAARLTTLVSGGFTKEDAEAKITAFAALTDDQFNLVATELIQAKKHTNSENPNNVEAEDVDDAEVTDATVTSGSVDNDLDVSDLAKKLSAELNTKDGDK